ncbi:MurR/RpiR family transcriptional regulator [Erysipelothrix urinaevulpis]|uniref:MurR/RpiR family transcriptional regulator n=1 Tax=Erysipelothrix urinaevulpis TaxID=2683717 RepID=UPI0013581C48|nr:hypothetical protein [Erysipelothrix urinaevulpis]
MKKDVLFHIQYNLNSYNKTEESIAYVLLNLQQSDDLDIKTIAKRSFTSPSSVTRFIQKLGFNNYKEFRYLLKQSLERPVDDDQSIAQSQYLWDNHNAFYENTYRHIAALDINTLSNRIVQSKDVLCFGFGKARIISDIFENQLDEMNLLTRKCTYCESLTQLINTSLDYNSLIVVFISDPLYIDLLNDIIKACKKKYIQIAVISLKDTSDIEKGHSITYSLHPNINNADMFHAATMYTPFLIFNDLLVSLVGQRLSTQTLAFNL